MDEHHAVLNDLLLLLMTASCYSAIRVTLLPVRLSSLLLVNQMTYGDNAVHSVFSCTYGHCS